MRQLRREARHGSRAVTNHWVGPAPNVPEDLDEVFGSTPAPRYAQRKRILKIPRSSTSTQAPTRRATSLRRPRTLRSARRARFRRRSGCATAPARRRRRRASRWTSAPSGFGCRRARADFLYRVVASMRPRLPDRATLLRSQPVEFKGNFTQTLESSRAMLDQLANVRCLRGNTYGGLVVRRTMYVLAAASPHV